jgi:UDP-N-acetylglucosamine:LPS N-acetylglucosamine transferase
VRQLAERWKDRTDIAIRHVIGARDYADFISGALPDGALVYQVVEYEERMDLLLAAADVAVTRAGGSVAELAAMGVPAVLVPLPIATRDHQSANARVFVESGAALLIPDDELTADRLETELAPLLVDTDRREEMAEAMRANAHLGATEAVAALIEQKAAP